VFEDLEFVVGSLGGEHLRLRHLQFYPEATDEWSRSWVTTLIDVCVGGFPGQVKAALRSEDFRRFHRDLACLYEELRGEATFETLEGWLQLKVVGDGLGHFAMDGEVTDYPGTGNRLRFELSFDQTEVPPMLRSLAAILAVCPA